MEEEAFLPFPVGIIQIGEWIRRHGICRLTQQPVFVLKRKQKHAPLKKGTKTHY